MILQNRTSYIFNKDLISYNVTLCFRIFGNPSYTAVNAVSSRANCESKPKKNNMKKNKTDHNQGRGNLANAVGYTTKAKPWPASATWSISIPNSWDRFPKTEKITHEAIIEVKKSKEETKAASEIKEINYCI